MVYLIINGELRSIVKLYYLQVHFVWGMQGLSLPSGGGGGVIYTNYVGGTHRFIAEPLVLRLCAGKHSRMHFMSVGHTDL